MGNMTPLSLPLPLVSLCLRRFLSIFQSSACIQMHTIFHYISDFFLWFFIFVSLSPPPTSPHCPPPLYLDSMGNVSKAFALNNTSILSRKPPSLIFFQGQFQSPCLSTFSALGIIRGIEEWYANPKSKCRLISQKWPVPNLRTICVCSWVTVARKLFP